MPDGIVVLKAPRTGRFFCPCAGTVAGVAVTSLRHDNRAPGAYHRALPPAPPVFPPSKRCAAQAAGATCTTY